MEGSGNDAVQLLLNPSLSFLFLYYYCLAGFTCEFDELISCFGNSLVNDSRYNIRLSWTLDIHPWFAKIWRNCSDIYKLDMYSDIISSCIALNNIQNVFSKYAYLEQRIIWRFSFSITFALHFLSFSSLKHKVLETQITNAYLKA